MFTFVNTYLKIKMLPAFALFWIMQLTFGMEMLHTIEPRKNLWVTWANQTKTSSFCLSLASATDPFRTCLIGVPGFDNASFAGFSTNNCSDSKNTSYCTALLLSGLNVSLPWDPQEIDLLGSRALSANETGCVLFGGPVLQMNGVSTNGTWLTPHNYAFGNSSAYCQNQSDPYGWDSGHIHMWANNTPLALPPKVFLICGDRAWHGVPKNAHGGPCYLGQLTLLALNKSMINEMRKSTRTKRSMAPLDPNCNDQVQLWDKTSRIFASLVPAVGTAHALATLDKLACWVSKQSNVTTHILEQLSQDMDSLRHVVLQNRAAIDFLLLAQGHGCEDFDGMCCFNLSNHGDSIHQQLQWLKEHSAKITTQNDLFGIPWESWGISGWFRYMLQWGIIVLITIVSISVILPCVLQCLRQSVLRATHQMWLTQIQKENGGNVESIIGTWLAEKGHDQVELVRQ